MTKEQLIALLNDMSLEEKVNQMSQIGRASCRERV